MIVILCEEIVLGILVEQSLWPDEIGLHFDLDINLHNKVCFSAAMMAARVKPCIEIVLCMFYKLAIMAC